jgi:hypothetical protein
MCRCLAEKNSADLYSFMESLDWVDRTYIAKHKSEDPHSLRAMYYPNLRMYSGHSKSTEPGAKKTPVDAIVAMLYRFGKRAGISMAVYLLSFLPLIGRFVLPAASFYTFDKAVGFQPAAAIFATSIFLPKRYLIVFLQTYFASRTLTRELVCDKPKQKLTDLFSWSLTSAALNTPTPRRSNGSKIVKGFCLALP